MYTPGMQPNTRFHNTLTRAHTHRHILTASGRTHVCSPMLSSSYVLYMCVCVSLSERDSCDCAFSSWINKRTRALPRIVFCARVRGMKLFTIYPQKISQKVREDPSACLNLLIECTLSSSRKLGVRSYVLVIYMVTINGDIISRGKRDCLQSPRSKFRIIHQCWSHSLRSINNSNPATNALLLHCQTTI